MDSMFVLKQGTVGVRLAKVVAEIEADYLDKFGKQVAELHEPDFFGDVALTEDDSTRTVGILRHAVLPARRCAPVRLQAKFLTPLPAL